MSERPVSRALLKFAAMATAAVLAFGTTSTAAFAQTDPTTPSPAPTETSTPPPTTETPPPPAQVQPPPEKTTGDVSGVLYADKNRNGRQDPGEAISGGAVRFYGGSDGAEHETTSDADGEFAFADLTPGTYQPTYELADGWVVHHTKTGGDLVTVTANQSVEVRARAERRYSEQLKATAALDRESYQHPASALIKLNLVNISDHAISGIQAACDRADAANALGRAEGWKVLKGGGLKLEAGEQRTIYLVEEIPLAAREQGTVQLDCDFAPLASWNTDGPSVRDEAVVTGGTGGYTMVVGQDRNADSRIDPAEAVSGVDVVLLHPQTGAQVAEGRSDRAGRIEFPGLCRSATTGPW